LRIGNAGLEKEIGNLKDAAQYVMDLYVPREEGVPPKEMVDRLDEAESRIKRCCWTPPSLRWLQRCRQ
jgi:hypothetical protein